MRISVGMWCVVVALAAVGPSSAAVADPWSPISVDMTASSLSLESPVGGSSYKSVILRNNGLETITLHWSTTPGDGDFITSAEPGYEIEPGSSHQLGVTFRPVARAPSSGRIRIKIGIGPSVIEKHKRELRTRLNALIDSDSKRLDALRRAGPDLQRLDRELLQIEVGWAKRRPELEATIQKLRREWFALIAERDRALDELRRGRLCSDCHRPASQIEREDRKPFEEHIRDRPGRAAVPATKEQIEAKSQWYADKIALAQRAVSASELDLSAAAQRRETDRQSNARARDLVEAEHKRSVTQLAENVKATRLELQRKLDEADHRGEHTETKILSLRGVGR